MKPKIKKNALKGKFLTIIQQLATLMAKLWVYSSPDQRPFSPESRKAPPFSMQQKNLKVSEEKKLKTKERDSKRKVIKPLIPSQKKSELDISSERPKEHTSKKSIDSIHFGKFSDEESKSSKKIHSNEYQGKVGASQDYKGNCGFLLFFNGSDHCV